MKLPFRIIGIVFIVSLPWVLHGIASGQLLDALGFAFIATITVLGLAYGELES